MSDRLMGALLSASSFRGGAAWTFVWQSTLWLAIGLIAARIWRRRAGRAHLLLILATSAALISPLLTVTVHWMQWGVLSSPPETVSAAPETATAPLEVPQQTQQSVAIAPIELPIDPPSNAAPAPEPNVRQPIAAAEERPAAPAEPQSASQPEAVSAAAWTARVAGLVPLVIAGVWVTASLVLTMRLMLSLFAGRRIARRAREEPNPRLREALREAADALSLSSPPHLRVSDLLRCPMIWCWGTRAVVLLPESVSEQAPIFWRSVFCHELAHLIRRDHWSALWAEFMVIILPWQPLGWRCRRRLAYLREQACDDWVLAAGGTATEYAESLLQFVPQGSPVHALAAVSSRESLKRRLEHVLAGVRIAPKAGRGWIAAASLFALAGIAGVSLAQQGRRAPAPAVVAEVKPAAKPTGQESPPPALSPGVVTVRGRVLLPNGRPAVGATVRAVKWAYHRFGARPEEQTVLATLVVDSQGGFQGNVDVGPLREPGLEINLWATLYGYGLALHPLVPAEKSGLIEMKLVEDEPIRGRVVDLEGQPVRDARIEVFRYYDTTTQWVDQFLASAAAVQGAPDTVLFNVMRDEAKPGRDQVVLRIKAMESVSDVLIPAVKTNADGRFEIKGCGRDRLIDAAISGPRIATVDTPILTRPIKSLQFSHREVFGSQCECVAPPSVPVEGAVADEETGQPIPGARIIHTAVRRGSGILGSDPRLALRLSRTTDAQGHYRLEGLETGSANSFQITVPDLPYPPVENLSLPASTSLKPIQHDIKLRRGVWAVGRAYDRKDAKPVAGMVYYTPFRSNKFARNYERYRKQPTDFLANYPFGSVDGDGRFKIPVIPGRGVVCLKCTEGNYRPNLGRGEIKELAGSDRMTSALSGPTYERLLSEPFHAVREINVPIDARETHVDLPVDPGQNVILTLTDASGNPLAGLDTYGLRLDWRNRMDRNRSYVESSSTILLGSSPDETRTIWIRHRATGLFKLLRFTPKPGETARKIVLEPPAVVTGRLVTAEGAPISGSEIEVVFDPNSADRLPMVKTDADGRFREELPAGGPFELYAHPFPFAFFAKKLSVDVGERVDLGEITIDRDQKNRPFQPKINRGPEKRTKPPAVAKVTTASAPAVVVGQLPKEDAPKSDAPNPETPRRDASKSEAPTTIRQVQGRVLLPNGQPAVGATVRAIRTKFRPGGFAREPEVQLLATFSTDSKGQFHGSVDNVSEEELRNDRNPRDVRIVNLWATLPGYGAVVQQFVATQNSDPIVLQLVDEEPIHGRIIDLEGRPVREARVEIINHFTTTSAFVDQWLASASGKEKPRFSVRELTSEPHEWAKNNRDYAILRGTSSDFVSDAIFPAAKTDSDGRFELRGVGRDREVVLRISGSRITANRARIVTRPIKSIPFQWHEISGSQFQIVVQPSVPVEGLVTDIDRGKPIPGALILPQSVARDRGPVEGLGAPVSAATDSQGHYRLEGLETNSFNYLSVVVPDLPYFWARFVDVPTAKSLKPIRRDIQLKRGIWAVGRAYDQSTGKPVSGRVSYLPFRSNEFARKYPTIQSNFNSNFPGPVVDAEGRFRVLVAPGRGVVRLTCSVGDYRFNFGESQTKEFDDLGLWTTMFHAVREINVAPDAPEVALDLPVVPGQNIVLHFTDAAGKRLAGIETYGLRFPNPRSVPGRGKSFVEGDWATLYATYPGEARTIWLRHRSSGLARLLQFSPKAGETKRTIILEPPAVVTGHVTTPEGAPLSNRKIDCRFNGADVIELPSALGDVDGRFRAELPAGGPFSLSFQNLVVRLADDLTVVAGEQVDLGDMTIASNEKRPGKTKIHRGPEKRTKPPVVANAATASAAVSTVREMPPPDTRGAVPASSDQAVQDISGVIVNEKGEPMAGARLAVIARLKRTRRGGDLGESPSILGEAVTEAGGKFRLRVPRIPSTGVWFSKLIARGDGYGLAGRALKTDVDSPDLKLTLPPEQVLRGRFVDLQGSSGPCAIYIADT
jgi:beta-lactamase regulating signal transducer with metallopeptidase domain